MKNLAIRAVLLIAVLAFFAGVALHWRWDIQPLPMATAADVEILPGESLHAAADKFQAQGVLPSAREFVLYAKLRRLTGAVRAGEYRVEPGTTLAGLLELLCSGKVVMHSLTLAEGLTVKQWLALVEADPNLTHSLKGLGARAVMQRIGGGDMSPEGYLLPDTYQFPRGLSDVAFLRRARAAADQELDKAWQGRAPGLPYKSPYDALILASIVEKETGQPTERGEIAGVFVRRLQKGMKLQSDPTIIYGLGDAYDGNLRLKDLHTDSPYNSYTRYGLPPTPICNPGRAAIQAVMHPTPGNALYFVAKGDGTHQFSATLAEQNAAVRKYQLHQGTPP